jgi:adenosylhomocysteine nucleosidase
MLLRWIVNNYLREAAEQKVRAAVSDVLTQRGQPGQKSSAPASAALQPASQPTGGAAADDEFLPCEVAFLFALDLEAGGLVDALKDSETSRHKHGTEHAGVLDGRQVVVVESGIGPAAAARATKAAINFYKPRWVVSAGFAAALDENLRRGHVLLADEVASPDGRKLDVGLKLDPAILAATKGLHVGRLLSIDKLIRKPAERRQLYQEHAALACDMETLAVAEACREAGVRLLAVRIISDAVDDELPPEIEHLLAQKTLVGKLGAATGAMLKRFSAAKDLWNLREDALKASDRLAKFLRGMVKQLD